MINRVDIQFFQNSFPSRPKSIRRKGFRLKTIFEG